MTSNYLLLSYQGDPSDLTIVNAKGGKIITVEGREHNLVCMVTSGQPGGNITWSTYGAVVAINRPSMVSYRFIPQRSDNGNVLQCEAFNSQGESILESSVYLDVFCKMIFSVIVILNTLFSNHTNIYLHKLEHGLLVT